MTTSDDAAVIPADPVLHGELIDDEGPPGGQHEQYRRAASWWQRSPRVPAAFRNRAHAVQAAKDATVAMVRAPWRFVGATGRGTVLAARAWRHWVTVRDYREAAEHSEPVGKWGGWVCPR
jgi:S-DNA-T family DNA segregation ATPase FtsK/SpoIIIE